MGIVDSIEMRISPRCVRVRGRGGRRGGGGHFCCDAPGLSWSGTVPSDDASPQDETVHPHPAPLEAGPTWTLATAAVLTGNREYPVSPRPVIRLKTGVGFSNSTSVVALPPKLVSLF